MLLRFHNQTAVPQNLDYLKILSDSAEDILKNFE